jgi:hypothetical protein
MSEKLCPCCNRAALSLFDGVEMPNEEYAVCVACEKCGLAGPDGEDAQTAHKLWDKNATIILAARLNEKILSETDNQQIERKDYGLVLR